MKKLFTKNNIIAVSVIIVLLAVVFVFEGTDRVSEVTPTPVSEVEQSATAQPVMTPTPTADAQPQTTDEPALKPSATAQPVITPTPQHEVETEDETLTCYISVECKSVLNNMDKLKPGKESVIPPDGIIFPKTEVVFYEGESAFNVLLREMKKNRIHLEYVSTPVYNSCYIEGLNNLYEFDCGELSGWLYKANGVSPGYGSSRYVVNDGDYIEWIYTCELGRDVGGSMNKELV